jgi:hypothetical protein
VLLLLCFAALLLHSAFTLGSSSCCFPPTALPSRANPCATTPQLRSIPAHFTQPSVYTSGVFLFGAASRLQSKIHRDLGVQRNLSP